MKTRAVFDVVAWNVADSRTFLSIQSKYNTLQSSLHIQRSALLDDGTCPRSLLLRVGFTIDTYFFLDNFFDSEGHLFFFFLFCTKTMWVKVVKLQEKVSEVIFNKLWSGWPCYKTNIRTLRLCIHSAHCHDCAFSWSIKFQYWPNFFLDRLNGNTFWVYRQYTLYLKILRYGSLVVVFSNFAGRHKAVVAGENGPQNFPDDVLDCAFNQWIRAQSWI